jgi:hypothetical protein
VGEGSGRWRPRQGGEGDRTGCPGGRAGGRRVEGSAGSLEGTPRAAAAVATGETTVAAPRDVAGGGAGRAGKIGAVLAGEWLSASRGILTARGGKGNSWLEGVT